MPQRKRTPPVDENLEDDKWFTPYETFLDEDEEVPGTFPPANPDYVRPNRFDDDNGAELFAPGELDVWNAARDRALHPEPVAPPHPAEASGE